MSKSTPKIFDGPTPGLERVRDALRHAWEEGKASGIAGRYDISQLLEEAREEIPGSDTRNP
jgi:hypothetical protein